MKKKFKRKLSNILINPGFQLKAAFLIFWSGLCIGAANIALFYLFIQALQERNPTDAALVDEALSKMMLGAIVVTALLSFAATAVSIFITHRAAGPAYHIKKVIEKIRAGETNARVNLRKNDEFQDVAQSFNKMADELKLE